MSVNGTTADALRDLAGFLQINCDLTADSITYSARDGRGSFTIQVTTTKGRSDAEQRAEMDKWAARLGSPVTFGPYDFEDREPGTTVGAFECSATRERFDWHIFAPVYTAPEAVSA